MALSVEQGKKIFIETIRKDLRHRDYDRVNEIAKMYNTFITGEDIDHMLIQFSPRENDDQFNQRKRITEVITPYIAARVMAPMYKVGRTLATKTITWDDKEKNEENKKKLDDALLIYAGDESLEDYLTTAMVDLDSTDPNTFIVTDFEGAVNSKDVNSKARPYPFEVNSEEAINYKYKNNELQFLIVLNKIEKANRFTIYLENDAFVAQQITLDEWKILSNDTKNEILFKDPEKKQEGEIYVITTANHKAGRVPAIRVGNKKDLKTRKRTCVPLIHPAKSFFKKSIKTISEFDLTNNNHVFPQKIQYDTVCPGDLSSNVLCNNGKTPSGDVCKECKGSGYNEHKSSSDIIRVKMPGDLSQIVSLDNFLTYKAPPIELIEFMKKLGLYEFPDLATKAVYTSEMFTSDNVVATATEKTIDLDSVYDTLKPFANKWSAVYRHNVYVVAEYIDLGKDLSVTHQFPKDFKMKGVTALLEDLGKANSGGAPSYIKKEINRDIANKIYVDKPEELLIIGVKEKFFPFNGKTESEITTVINNNLTTQFNKILYANYDTIFDELDQENSTDKVSFWKMEPTKQKELLNTKVQLYMDNIANEGASQRADDFGNANEGAAGASDTQLHNAGDAVTYNKQPVEIVNANPGPDGGIYTVKLNDGTTQELKGTELTAAI